MYIWNVKLQEKWNDEDRYYDDYSEYVVTAKTYEVALKKAEKVAKKKTYIDDDTNIKHMVVETRLISIERGSEIDA